MTQAAVANSAELNGAPVGGAALVPGSSTRDLPAALAYCREVTRDRARNFYYGLRLTPEPRRSAIYAVYAWMRAADDAVDEAGSPDERRRRLDRFTGWTERLLDAAAQGGVEGDGDTGSSELLARALVATIRNYGLDAAIFRDLIEGMRRDLSDAAFEDETELERYCYCVAGTAGLACVSIWGLREGASAVRSRELALHRGQAFQRTNILRDFAEDFDGADGPRRVYLPRDLFERHGLSPEDLRRWQPAGRCEALVQEQAALAREHYRRSAELETLVDPACAPTLWAMTRIYSGLLLQIEADPSRLVGERVRLAPAAKATIAIRAAIGARMRRW